ncbi:hypothetical protein E2C01_095482 [Portunus trituberculatus]|uniref:Uncharacterized protein n=1 Tax=Portunus trituberculatus TaxID=210409 RepID=A0A5B7K095_PORTR|nr:hypothetical protein [Portunus trituberculatus]
MDGDMWGWTVQCYSEEVTNVIALEVRGLKVISLRNMLMSTDNHSMQINTQQTKDLDFDKEVDKFRSMQRCAAVLAQDMDALLQGVKARHRAELGVVKGLIEILLQAGVEVKSLHSVALDSAGRLFETFVSSGGCCGCIVTVELLKKVGDKVFKA